MLQVLDAIVATARITKVNKMGVKHTTESQKVPERAIALSKKMSKSASIAFCVEKAIVCIEPSNYLGVLMLNSVSLVMFF